LSYPGKQREAYPGWWQSRDPGRSAAANGPGRHVRAGGSWRWVV